MAGARPRRMSVNSGLALLGDAAAKGGTLVTVILAARLLPTAEFARLGVALATAGILTTVLDAGTSTLLVRDGARGASDRGRVLRDSLVARTPLAFVVTCAVLAAGAAVGEPSLAAATLLLALAGAAALTVLAVFRAAQDLAPEAALKTAAAASGLAGVTVALLVAPSALTVVCVLAAVATLAPLALARRARRAVSLPQGPGTARRTLLTALPFAGMAIATIAYYRSGTLLLGAISTPTETAAFTLASTLAFGLLLVPNAITTGLLPRLAASTSTKDIARTARRALGATIVACLAAGAAASAAAVLLLPALFGEQYEAAVAPLVLLAACTVVIGANAILGVTLIALRRTRVVAIQVAVSLAVNLGLGVGLVQRFGADGAAAATAATELVALVLLSHAVHRSVPGLLAWRRPAGSGRFSAPRGARA